MATRDLLAAVAAEPGYPGSGQEWRRAVRSRAWVVAGPSGDSGGWAGGPAL